ncbi:MAG TPA: GntR family transcriptional regulator, partial [Synergistales bacterium]|nr:GntR family transcriptional regulator [Synergistales bacterium]
MENVKVKTKIYDQVVDRIKQRISEGELPQGSALPPERQLIDELNVSRSSLREGFRILEMMGMIE